MLCVGRPRCAGAGAAQITLLHAFLARRTAARCVCSRNLRGLEMNHLHSCVKYMISQWIAKGESSNQFEIWKATVSTHPDACGLMCLGHPP